MTFIWLTLLTFLKISHALLMGMKQQGFLTKLKYKRIYALTAREANFFDLFNLSCLHIGTKIHTKDIPMIS